MILTREEFSRIRPLQWSLTEVGGQLYNTTADQKDCALFWYDFMKNVFAPKFKQQNGITYIANFDQKERVLITNELELKLPSILETAMYYASNKTPPRRFSVNVSQNIVLLIAFAVLALLFVSAFLARPVSGNGEPGSIERSFL